MPSRKNRTPSKCREWERERRNRFNDACKKLAALIITNENGDGETSNVQPNLAKVEVVLRAITFINSLLQTKSQLNAQLLAAHAELSGIKKSKANVKDVSIQVKFFSKDSKTKKLLPMEEERKENVLLIKKNQSKPEVSDCNVSVQPKLAKILPKSSVNKKDKGVIVCPAGTYILPRRPAALPPQPTLFVLEPLMSPSRNMMAVMPRVVSEITKTTMVNNIPITAFSFPLSGSKNNKSNEKSILKKQGVVQKRRLKVIKKIKATNKDSMENKKENLEEKENKLPEQVNKELNHHVEPEINKVEEVKVVKINTDSTSSKEVCTSKEPESILNKVANESVLKTNDNAENTANDANVSLSENISKVSDLTYNSSDSKMINDNQVPAQENKEKQEKIESILDTSICDSTVDGGNARLELAEELLAASPTAAFLMTFPLVSGVRADSPADDDHNTGSTSTLRSSNQQKRDNSSLDHSNIETLLRKTSQENKIEHSINANTISVPQFDDKLKNPEKQISLKPNFASSQALSMTPQTLSENSYLNLIPSVLNSANTANDNLFSLDFDTTFSKNTTTSTAYPYVSSSNLLFKSDSFNSKANLAMYTSNGLPVGHDYNNFGFYPCAVEKYSQNGKNKNELVPCDDNSAKIASGRYPYDFDLNLSQKPFEFTSNANSFSTIQKDNIFNPITTVQNSYNPFNPDIHVPLSSNSTNNLSNKKANPKSNPFYADTFSNLYSQPSNLWPDDLNLYSSNNSNSSKMSIKPPNHMKTNQFVGNINKFSNINSFETKDSSFVSTIPNKSSKLEVNHLVQDKNIKKLPSKSHINWMTSEARSSHSQSFDQQNEIKDQSRVNISGMMQPNAFLPHLDYNVSKKQDYLDTNLFPLSLPSHSNQDDVQLWPPTRPFVASELGLDPPPISLPTLVGDLALGPQERRKSVERVNRSGMSQESTGFNNFLSVSQLMNRTNDLSIPRSQSNMNENQKIAGRTDNLFAYSNVAADKSSNNIDRNNAQPCYLLNDSKFLPMQYNMSQPKQKSTKSSDRTKGHKNNYSTEALLRGPNSGHKLTDNFSSMKFVNPTQKFVGYPSNQESQMAQVSHFPCITEYPDNSYQSSSLYNSATATVSNPLYGNLMSASYTPANFTPEFVDYTSAASADCNFYPIFDNYKVKNQVENYGQVKPASDLIKSSHKDNLGKHKAELSKKENSRKFTNKRVKVSNECEEWNENGDNIHHTRSSKKNMYTIPEEIHFTNYSINQGQTNNAVPDALGYSSSMPPPIAARPVHFPTNVSRTNFNLSTLFPEIAKVRQS